MHRSLFTMINQSNADSILERQLTERKPSYISNVHSEFKLETAEKCALMCVGGNLTFKIACSAPSFTAGYLLRASAERARRSASRAATKAIFRYLKLLEIFVGGERVAPIARVYDVTTES